VASVQPGSGYRTPGRESGAAARNRRAGNTEQAVDGDADALFARCLHVPCATKQCSGLFYFLVNFGPVFVRWCKGWETVVGSGGQWWAVCSSGAVIASEASAGSVERGRNVSRGTGHANVVGRARLGLAAWHRADNDIIMEQSVSGVVMLAVGSRRGRRMRVCTWNRTVESGAVRVCAGCVLGVLGVLAVGGPRKCSREGRSGRSGQEQGGRKTVRVRVRGIHGHVEGAVAEVRTPSQRQRRGLDPTRLDSTHGSAACLRACPPACPPACLPACLLPTRYSAAHRAAAQQPLSTPQSRVL
jgi:hypothetical protein